MQKAGDQSHTSISPHLEFLTDGRGGGGLRRGTRSGPPQHSEGVGGGGGGCVRGLSLGAPHASSPCGVTGAGKDERSCLSSEPPHWPSTHGDIQPTTWGYSCREVTGIAGSPLPFPL